MQRLPLHLRTGRSFTQLPELPPIEQNASREEPLHVAIVGAGFSGTSVFKQLAEQPPEGRPIKLSIIETRAMLGAGGPYSKDNPSSYIVNNHANKMSVDPQDREHFKKWLEKNIDRLKESFPDLTADALEYVPRQVFGLYLQDAFLTAEATAKALGMSVEVYRARVKDLELVDGGDKVKLSLEGREPIIADKCVFTGHGWMPSPIDHLKESNAVKNGGCTVITQHIPGDEIDRLPLDAEIAIVGSSLSALDVVSRLFAPETGCKFERNEKGELEFIPGPNTRKVTLCSRSGRFPRIRPDAFSPVPLQHFTKENVDALLKRGELDLAALAKLADRDIAAAGVKIDWNEVLRPYEGLTQDEINQKLMRTLATEIEAAHGRIPETPDIFLHRFLVSAFAVILDVFENQKLSAEDQMRARRQIEAVFLQYVAACPPETSEMALALLESGHLKVLAGVSSFDGDGDTIRIAHPEGTLETKTLINAAGMPDRDPTKNGDPLIRSLLEKQVLTPYRRDGKLMGGIDFDPKTMQAIGPDGRPSKSLYVLGELLKGREFLVNATFLLNNLTTRVAQSIRAEANASAPAGEKARAEVAAEAPVKKPRMRKLIGAAA